MVRCLGYIILRLYIELQQLFIYLYLFSPWLLFDDAHTFSCFDMSIFLYDAYSVSWDDLPSAETWILNSDSMMHASSHDGLMVGRFDLVVSIVVGW